MMKNTRSMVGEHVVIASGSILSYEDNPVRLTLNPEPDNTILVNFAFRTDRNSDKKRILAKSVEGSGEVDILLENFNRGIGGSQKPGMIAESTTQELWLFFIVTSSEDSHLVNYTFFLKPKQVKAKGAKNGKKEAK